MQLKIDPSQLKNHINYVLFLTLYLFNQNCHYYILLLGLILNHGILNAQNYLES